jgi:hypothetical protein
MHTIVPEVVVGLGNSPTPGVADVARQSPIVDRPADASNWSWVKLELGMLSGFSVLEFDRVDATHDSSTSTSWSGWYAIRTRMRHCRLAVMSRSLAMDAS